MNAAKRKNTRKFPRVHTFKITATFNRGVRRSQALSEVKSSLNGEYWCSVMEDSDPDRFRVASIKNYTRAQS